MCACSVASAMSDCLCPCGLKPVRLLCSMDSSSKNTGALLQGIFPTPELNPCLLHLLHCRWILYPLSHLGSPNNKVSIQNSAYLTSSQLVLMLVVNTLCVCVCEWLSRIWIFVTLWTVPRQAPLTLEFSRQEYCSGLPFSSLKDLPDLAIEPRSPALQADSLPSELPEKPITMPVSNKGLPFAP